MQVLTKGGGAYHPTVNSPCSCHYKGALLNGDEFDSSYKRGEPTSFAPNQVIRGVLWAVLWWCYSGVIVVV
jgi:FKBP-type peptidyl-prolyl cis-trans isomerase FklB